jgi:hypothetical protein
MAEEAPATLLCHPHQQQHQQQQEQQQPPLVMAIKAKHQRSSSGKHRSLEV